MQEEPSPNIKISDEDVGMLYGGPCDGEEHQCPITASAIIAHHLGHEEVYTYSPYVTRHLERPCYIHSSLEHDFLAP